MPLNERCPVGFDNPTLLPADEGQRQAWQQQNRDWWESHPMRYDWREAIPYPEYSREFYQEIDRRFFTESRKFLPWKKIPFDALIDFDALATQDVLEIGVGNGSHAQLLASHARSYTGIDLTSYAVKSTTERMRCFGLKATIRQMDAELMDFPDHSFDFIWSWGVIHHSSNTRQILQQMHRVLRPGGTAITMVYYRNFWNYYVVPGLLHGVLRGELWTVGSLHDIAQRHTDGALARHYTIPQWHAEVASWFNARSRIMGNKAEVVPLPPGRFKNRVLKMVPDGLTAFLTNRCRMGTFLVTHLDRK